MLLQTYVLTHYLTSSHKNFLKWKFRFLNLNDQIQATHYT